MAAIVWENNRHRAGIAGRVVDLHTGQAIGAARVRIVEAPVTFVDFVAARVKLVPLPGVPEAIKEERAKLTTATGAAKLAAAGRILDYFSAVERRGRPDQVETVADGRFHFLDLPAGRYTLAASLPSASTRYGEVRATADLVATGGSIPCIRLPDVRLPSNAVKGRITGIDPASGIAMAEVRVGGSGERVFSNKSGDYLLTGIEQGERVLLVSAPSHQAMEKKVVVAGGKTVEMNLTLQPVA